MLRILLQYVLPLALPFVVYLIYARLTHRAGGLAGAPLIGLTAAGVALTALSLAAWTLLSGSEPGETYVPARFEDGELLPGETGP